MYETLRNGGYTVSYTTVRNYVNKPIAKIKEVFIRRHCDPDVEVEFDCGEVNLVINGNITAILLNDNRAVFVYLALY